VVMMPRCRIATDNIVAANAVALRLRGPDEDVWCRAGTHYLNRSEQLSGDPRGSMKMRAALCCPIRTAHAMHDAFEQFGALRQSR